MSQTLAPEIDPDSSPRSEGNAGATDEQVEAASRGLMLVAALLIIVPAAIGLYILRSGSTPAPPGAAAEEAFVPPALEGDATEGPTSAELLQPANAGSGRLRYQVGDKTAGLGNGGIVSLGNGIGMQVTVSPYPPTEFETDIELTLSDAAGNPVTDARITAEWDMVMVHGPFFSDFEHVGDGHYRAATFDFFMYGPWQLDALVETPRGETSVKLAVYVWPE